jgi:hypothetical protein
MNRTISARLVQEWSSQLHGLEFSEARSAELAADVERHNAAIRAAAPQLDFNDEPARFAALLAAHRDAGSAKR